MHRLAATLLATVLGLASPLAYSELTLNEDESLQLGSDTPLSPMRLGKVSFHNKVSCMTCGDSVYRAHPSLVLTKISSDAMNEVKRQLRNNGVLSKTGDERVSLDVTLEKLSHDHTKGAAIQREAKLTNGGEMVTTIVLRYQLTSPSGTFFLKTIETQGRSDSLGEIAEPEALDDALGKNIRTFLLYLKAALTGTDETATAQIATQINSKAGGTRGVFGTLFKGAAHVGIAAGTVAEGTLEVLGSDAMAGAMSAAATQMRDNQRQFDRIQHQAMMASANGRPPSERTSHPSAGSATNPAPPTIAAKTQQAPPSQTTARVADARVTAVNTPPAGIASASTASTASTASPAPSVKTEPPDDRPRVGGPPNKQGCWIPDRSKPMCMVVVSEENRKGTMRVGYRNDCQWGIYALFENERTNGSWDSGADNLSPGQQKTWSTSEATGQYRFNFTGSDRPQFDWVCAGEDRGLKAWRR